MKWYEMIWNQKRHSYPSLLPGTRSTAVVTTEPCQLVFCLASEKMDPKTSTTSTTCLESRKSIRSKSNLELVATGLIVIWQYLLRGPPACLTEIGLISVLCVYHKIRGSPDPTVLIESILIWDAAVALVNVVELHRPLGTCYKMRYIDMASVAIKESAKCFQGNEAQTMVKLEELQTNRMICLSQDWSLHKHSMNSLWIWYFLDTWKDARKQQICNQMTSYIKTNLITWEAVHAV